MKSSIPTTLLCLLIALAACKRVEVITPDESVLLPLAKGNRWVYIDSFFTETTIPSMDTLVRRVSYRIEAGIAIDYKRETGPDKGKILRTQGWKLLNDNSNSGVEYVFVLDDTVFSTASYGYFPSQAKSGQCNVIRAAMDIEPSHRFISSSPYMRFRPLVWENGAMGSQMNCYPAFMDLPSECIQGLGPQTQLGARFEFAFQPLSPAGTTEVTVPAGTFTCQNLGYQKWAEGVGMVSSELTGPGLWFDGSGPTPTGNLRWKRVLSSYKVN